MKENKIQNYRDYCDGMHKSLEDKLFFKTFLKEHSEIKNFIDFGCADGVLLEQVQKQFPALSLYGIDQDSAMLLKANNRVPQAFYINSQFPNIAPENSVLNLSSVLHEVYSYGSEEYIREFWENIANSVFIYIFVRDMMYVENDELLSKAEVKSLLASLEACPSEEYVTRFFDFIYSKILTKKELVHFLLKYRYGTNWEREKREDYFSYSLEDLLQAMPDYSLIELKHYTLPFLKKQIKSDFNYDLDVPTHFHAIFKLTSKSAAIA